MVSSFFENLRWHLEDVGTWIGYALLYCVFLVFAFPFLVLLALFVLFVALVGIIIAAITGREVNIKL